MLKALLFAATLIAAPAHAHTSENVLFVCSGVLEGDRGGYQIIDKLDESDYPQYCYIDDKVVRQVLRVCHVGQSCIVSAKGESGNGGAYLIQKVFEAQRAPWLDEQLRGTADMPDDLMGSWCWDGGGPNVQTYHRCLKMTGGRGRSVLITRAGADSSGGAARAAVFPPAAAATALAAQRSLQRPRVMLSLSDAERAIIADVADALVPAQRDAFLRSVAVVLSQCTTRSSGLVYRLAKQEQRRLLEPPHRTRSQLSARFNGHA
jgi:hypothetical protein